MIDGTPKIVLTRRWPAAVEARLAELGEVIINEKDEPFTAAALAEALATADVVCPTVTDAMPASLFRANPRAGLLANFGVGFNHIDIAAADAAGIKVSNTPGVLTEATAEIALTLMLTSARRTGEGERHLRAGDWSGWRPTHMLSTQVTGKVLGIIGMGRIGTHLARQAHHGLGMRIVYFSRSPAAESVARELNAERVELDELLGRADFVSLHCPATPETRGLIDSSALRAMQSHAHLINTARGDIVDEAALVEALRAGTIAGAALDVYVDEPALTPGLAELENVVLLPHMGSGTTQTREAMGMCALANVAAYLRDEPLPNPVLL